MLQSYISLDLETTGLNPKLDKIIEIGAVKVCEDRIVDTFFTFVAPGRKLQNKVSELTGITDGMLTDAPDLIDVMPKLVSFLEDLPFVGHNILFDYSFLKKAAVNQKISFEKEAIDTLKISRKYLATLEHRTLEYLCEYYGIEIHAHRALEDARATAALYEKLAEAYETPQDALFQPAKLCYTVKKDQPAAKPQKERLYRLIAQHNITLELDVEKLTRSEASRLTDQLLAKYGRSYSD